MVWHIAFMYNNHMNVPCCIYDFRRTLFNGEADRAGDEDLCEATVSALNRELLLPLFSLGTCVAIAWRRVNELPTLLAVFAPRLNHADGGTGVFSGLVVQAIDVPNLFRRELVSPPR